MNTLVWFRRNLRVADNPALQAAIKAGTNGVAGLFVYDEQYTGEQFGLPRCGPIRANFLWQSVADLRESLADVPLLIREGDAAENIVQVCQALDIQVVHTQKLWGFEEQNTAAEVKERLHEIGVQLIEHECYTLLTNELVSMRHPTELTSFSKFRRKVGSLPEPGGGEIDGVRDVVSSVHQRPKILRLQPNLSTEFTRLLAAETAKNLSASPIAVEACSDPRATMAFVGGESAGLQRLADYCGLSQCDPEHAPQDAEHAIDSSAAVGHYKETRNGLIGADYSSKLSAWLNLGCISPQQVHAAVLAYEHAHGANASTEWLIVELLWRDFFQHLAHQLGASMFWGVAEPKGAVRAERMGSVSTVSDTVVTDPILSDTALTDPALTDPNLFSGWSAGSTENQFLDANMRELNASGYMSNRGRQNVASALIHDLQIDWRLGAAWFEAQLLDYDPASNYGNWQYIAGLAANPRGGSWFNLEKQANVYDTEGAYRRLWSSKS